MALEDEPRSGRRWLRPDFLGWFEERQRTGKGWDEEEVAPGGFARDGADADAPPAPAPEGLIQRWTRKAIQGPLYDLIVPHTSDDEELDRREDTPTPTPAPEEDDPRPGGDVEDDPRGPFPPKNRFLQNEPISGAPRSGDPFPPENSFLQNEPISDPPRSGELPTRPDKIRLASFTGKEGATQNDSGREKDETKPQQLAQASRIIQYLGESLPPIAAVIYAIIEEDRLRRERQGQTPRPAPDWFTPVKPENPILPGRPAEAIPPLRLPGFQPPVPPPPLSGSPIPDKDLVPPVQGFPNNADRGRRPLIVAGPGIRIADPDVVPLDGLNLEQLIPPADIGGIMILESRGGPFTQEGNAVWAEEIKKLAEKHYPGSKNLIRHTHGSYVGGDRTREDYRKEEVFKDPHRPEGVGHLWNAARGDLTLLIKDKAGKVAAKIVIQTVTTDRKDIPVGKEWDAAIKIVSRIKDADVRLVVMAPKLHPSDPSKGITEADKNLYRAPTRKMLQKLFESILGKPEVPFGKN